MYNVPFKIFLKNKKFQEHGTIYSLIIAAYTILNCADYILVIECEKYGFPFEGNLYAERQTSNESRKVELYTRVCPFFAKKL